MEPVLHPFQPEHTNKVSKEGSGKGDSPPSERNRSDGSRGPAWEQYDRVGDRLISDHPQLLDLFDIAREEVLAYTSFPLVHWRKIRANNPLENLNSHIKRRTKVVGIFPNRASLIRLVGMVLLEQHEDWMIGRRYIDLELLRSLDDDLSEREEELIEAEPECVMLHTPR